MDWYSALLFLWKAFFAVTALYTFLGEYVIPARVRENFPHIEMKTRLLSFFFASVAYCILLQMEEHNLRETLRSAVVLLSAVGVQTGLSLGYLRLREGKGAIRAFFRSWRR